jgi:hypothetical protein
MVEVIRTPPIVGSAEHLTGEARAARLRELAAWGVDLSLISTQMGKSPAQYLEEWLAFRAFIEAGQRALAEGHIVSAPGGETGRGTHG